MTDFANNESDGEQDTYSCADCGVKTNYAGLCAEFLKRDPDENPMHADLLCAECLEARKEEINV